MVRRYGIMAKAANAGSLELAQIKRMFGQDVTDQTIRNDLLAIAKFPKFVWDKSHNGLVSQGEYHFPPGYFRKSLDVSHEAKADIASAVLASTVPVRGDPERRLPLIDPDGDSVVVGPGTTSLEVLLQLAQCPGVEVLTCNFGIVRHPEIMNGSVHLTGGWLHSSIGCLVGSAAVQSMTEFSADTAVVGVSGLSFDQTAGDVLLYCHDEVQLPIKKALIKARRKLAVVTCRSRIDKRDAREFARIGALPPETELFLFTDMPPDGFPKKLSQRFEEIDCHNGDLGTMTHIYRAIREHSGD